MHGDLVSRDLRRIALRDPIIAWNASKMNELADAYGPAA
jgi:hypothetical protein